MQSKFARSCEGLLDACTRCEWPKDMCDLWLGTRLELAGEVIQLATALFLVAFTHNAALSGLALTTAGQLTCMS